MDEKPSIYLVNRLTYAIDSEGELVDIDSVSTGKKCNCFCPACQEPLVAKNQGSKRMHHFAHQTGKDCNYAIESMLHIFAKVRIQEAFLSKPEFWIDFEYNSFCPNYQECKYIRVYTDCYTKSRKRFNLKQFYDSCEQEVKYDNTNYCCPLKHNNPSPTS